jgi:hypothetical protein
MTSFIFTGQRSLLFQIPYPEIAAGTQPRIRIVSAFEQKVEQPDRNYQYVFHFFFFNISLCSPSLIDVCLGRLQICSGGS